MRSFGPILLLSATLTLTACGSDSTTGAAPASTPAAVAQTPATTTPATAATTSSAAAPKVRQGVCSNVPTLSSKDPSVPKPTGKLDPSKKNVVTMKTSCGTITIALDPAGNPITANAVAWLVSHKYYDGLSFTRIAQDFVIQGGDATNGTAQGPSGPDWTVVEAPKSTETYPKGTVAMAKTAADPSGTTNSQFFVMTGDNGLDPSYAVAGKVTAGMDAVNAIAKLANSTDGPPSRTVEIFKATFKAS